MKSLASLMFVGFVASGVQAAHHIVKVGQNGLKFEPENINALPGDTVEYNFYAKNHTVTQSTFNEPCKYQDKGFFSAFVPAESAEKAALTTYTITVKDSKPLWLFCSQGDHCKSGMVHAINAPPVGNTFEAYKKKAENASGEDKVPKDLLPFGGKRKLPVKVGENGLKFEPADIKEPARTVIEFSFYPKQHTVTQSSFDKPCEPIPDGLSSGFIPTEKSPSGVTFEVVVKDDKPVWFYCAQTTGSHCQKGMVGSINAAAEGERTLEAFKKLAEKAPESKIPPKAPLKGRLFVDKTAILRLPGNVLNLTAWEDMDMDDIPKPGKMNPYMKYLAGGDAIENYNWGKTIDDETVKHIQLLQWLDNILLSALIQFLGKLGGDWAGSYPEALMHGLKTMTAQTYVHRMTTTDTLQHYSKDTMKACKYDFDLTTVEAGLDTIVQLVTLELALLMDAVTVASQKDAWIVPNLSAAMGSKGRIAGILNMMQGHAAAASPREISMHPGLIYSYAMDKFVKSCPSEMREWEKLPSLKISKKEKNEESGRVESIKVDAEEDAKWAAFMGPMGRVWYAEVRDGEVEVPEELYGHVAMTLVDDKGDGKENLYNGTVAGPTMFWVQQP